MAQHRKILTFKLLDSWVVLGNVYALVHWIDADKIELYCRPVSSVQGRRP